jgi:hypothetical protein
VRERQTKIEISRFLVDSTTSAISNNKHLLHDSGFREGLLNGEFTFSLSSVIFGVRSKVGSGAREVHESFDAHFSGNFSNIASTNDVDLVRIEISAGPPLSGEIDNDVAMN